MVSELKKQTARVHVPPWTAVKPTKKRFVLNVQFKLFNSWTFFSSIFQRWKQTFWSVKVSTLGPWACFLDFWCVFWAISSKYHGSCGIWTKSREKWREDGGSPHRSPWRFPFSNLLQKHWIWPNSGLRKNLYRKFAFFRGHFTWYTKVGRKMYFWAKSIRVRGCRPRQPTDN